MEYTLLDRFKESRNIEYENLRIDNLTPTETLSLINSGTLEFQPSEILKQINRTENNSINVTNDILKNLEIEKKNITPLKFIFHELITNIYDHSKFRNAYVMGRTFDNYCEISFIDDGISIPQSLKNSNFEFSDDCEYIIQAINGLSTKNELGYIERGTGLNNTLNITINGASGSVLIVSNHALIYLTSKYLIKQELEDNYINGTLISLRLDLTQKIDIYKYLKQVKYE